MGASHAIDWVLLDHSAPRAVQVGDVVSVDAGGMPIYRVLALLDGEVQLANERNAAIGKMPLHRFRWRGAR